MCDDCQFDKEDFRELKSSVESLSDMINVMYDSFEYELVSKLVQPISVLKLPKRVSDELDQYDLPTLYDLIRSCGHSYGHHSTGRYKWVFLSERARQHIESKLNPLGLGLDLILPDCVLWKIHNRLGRDTTTGE